MKLFTIDIIIYVSHYAPMQVNMVQKIHTRFLEVLIISVECKNNNLGIYRRWNSIESMHLLCILVNTHKKD